MGDDPSEVLPTGTPLVFPTEMQARLAHFAIDLENYQPTRTNMACVQCRTRKIKCSGEKPTCSGCQKSGKVCHWTQPSQRKRKGEGQDQRNKLNVAGVDDIPGSSEPKSSSDKRSKTTPTSCTGKLPDHLIASTSSHVAPAINTHSSFPGQTSASDYASTRLHDITGYTSAANDFNTTVSNLNGPSPVSVRSGGRIVSKIRIPYFRYFGATAIEPGFKRVRCDVSVPSSPTNIPAVSPGQGLSIPLIVEPEPDGDVPHISAIQHLLPIFHRHFGYFFPSLALPPVATAYQIGSSPSFLINAICALAARYSPIYSDETYLESFGEGIKSPADSWMARAKADVGHRLAMATLELVETLLIISWFEFGADRDSGLWMYSGMAMRMAQDLGLDRVPQDQLLNPQDTESLWRCQRLHWSLSMMDAIMEIGTGRAGMYQLPSTSIPAFPPLIASNGRHLPDPLPYLVEIFGLVSKTSRILVESDRSGNIVPLHSTQLALNDFNMSLPPELNFQTITFQAYVPLDRGGAFVLLHLWFHTLIILAHDPSLLLADHSGSSVTEDIDGKEISVSSAKSILDIVAFAELIDPRAISQPWINYPIYTAARAFLAQSTRQSGDIGRTNVSRSAGRAHVISTASANYHRLVDTLTSLEGFWKGVSYIHRALTQRAEALEAGGTGVADGEIGERYDDEVGDGRDDTRQWLSNDLVGFGLTGTFNSPSDYHYTFVYPNLTSGPPSTGQNPIEVVNTNQMPAVLEQDLLPVDIAWAEAYLNEVMAAEGLSGDAAK